jgi:hypothetical protein
VTAEKAATHMADKNSRNIPQSGKLNASSSATIYLKNERFYGYIFDSWTLMITSITLQEYIIIVSPFYLLMFTYTVVQLFLHISRHFLRVLNLYLTTFLFTFIQVALSQCDVCPFDIQQRRSDLLQLTAGYTH